VSVPSAPLVVFLHAFTGKFLCGREVGRGHFIDLIERVSNKIICLFHFFYPKTQES